MINYDFNEPTDKELRELVTKYEESVKANRPEYFNENSLEQIVDYYLGKSQFSKALSALEDASSQFPFSAVFLTKKAEIFMEKNQTEKALDTIIRAEILDPNNIQLLLLKADAFLAQAKHDQAVIEVQKAIDICDDDELADLYLEMADVYEDWGKNYQILEYLEKALIIQARNEEALNRLWFVTEICEEYQRSIDFHNKLINIDPYNALAWFNMAHAYIGLKGFDEAVEAFKYAIAIDEKFTAPYRDCGDLLFRQNRYHEAIDMYLDAIHLIQPGKEIYFNLAVCFEKISDNRKARYYYKKALKIDPHFAEAFFRMGYNYGTDARYRQAITSLERAVSLKNKNVNYMRVLGYMYSQVEDYYKALGIYQKLVKDESERKENWINLANVLFDTGDVEESIKVLEEAESLFEFNSEFCYIKASILHAIGSKKEAMLNLEKGLAKNFDEHYIIFEINPNFENDPDIRNVIDQYKT